MPISAGTVAAMLTLDTKQFGTGLDKARSLVRTFQSDTRTASEKIRALGSAMQGLGKGLTLSVTSSVIGLGTAAVKTFTGFDDAIRQVRATMDATADETEALTQAAKDAGATTRYSAGEAAAALNYLALAGYDATSAVAALPDVLRLAQAGNMDLAYTSDLLTDSMSMLGKSKDYMTTFADQMTRASQRSNTSIAQLGEGILQVGGMAKDLAGDTVELNTVLGVLADNGIKGAEGGTHLRNILLALSGATDGSEKALEALGVRAFDDAGKLRPLADVFADLNAAMDGFTDQQRTKTISDIFRMTDIASVNVLLSTSAERWTELGGAIADSAGAARNAADTMEGGIGGASRSMKSAIEAAAVEFGENLAPMVQSAAEKVTGLARGFAGLSEGTQDTILRVAGFAAAAGPALIILGKLTTAAVALKGVLMGPAGLVALGVGAAATLGIALYNAAQEADGLQKGFRNAMRDVDQERVDAITAGIKVGFSFSGENGGSVVDQFRAQLPSVYDSIAASLTDGQEDDTETIAALEQKVRDYYAGQVSVVESWADEEIAKLDVNSAAYDTDVANIQTKAEELVATLRSLETESLDWISANAGRATATVQGRLGELDAIEARAQEVLDKIDEAAGAEAKLYETRVDLVKRGVDVSDENISAAIGWEKLKYEQQMARIREGASAERERLLAQVAAGALTDEDYALRRGVVDELESGDVARAAEAYKTSMGEIIAGIDQASGGTVHKAQEAQDMLDELRIFVEGLQGGGFLPSDVQYGASDALRTMLSEKYGFNIDEYSDALLTMNGRSRSAFNNRMDLIYAAEDAALARTDWNAISPAYKAMLDSGALDGVFGDLDLSGEEEQLKALFEMVGKAAPEGAGQGVADNADAATTPVGDMAEDMIETMREGLDSHSPSQEFRRIGVDTVDGLVLGLEDRRGALSAKARALALETAETVRAALDIHSPSKLFRGFGRNTAEGFALGIDDGLFRTEEALSRLTGFAPAGGGGGGVQPAQPAPVINVTLPNATVRSDEDAREIARGIATYVNRLNRGYGG